MTITKKGALTSFYTVNKAPIKHLRIYFSPKQAGTGDPSPENVREISGWSGIEITHCGKNLYNPANVIMNQELYPAGDLYPTGTTNNWCVSDYMPVKPNTTYIATALLTKGSGRYALYDENKNYIRGAQEKSGANAKTIITTNANARYVRLTIRIGDKLNTIFEEDIQENTYTYYPGQFHILDWSNNIGTVYGGYVDLVTGELVQDIYAVDSSLWKPYKENNGYTAYIINNTLPARDTTTNLFYLSNMISSFGSFNSNSMNKNIIQVTNYCALQSDIDISNLQWMYRIATPITHQLTPTQLQTLIGRNNIWSNADRVEVEYDLAESNDELYRRRNILLRTPHLVTTAPVSLQSFNTDMVAPLKECKVYFEPVQEGTGDPSPDNIRPISGWTGLTVYTAGTNLCYQPSQSSMLYIPLKQGTRVTAYGIGRINYYRADQTQIDYWSFIDGTRGFTLLEDTTYFSWSHPNNSSKNFLATRTVFDAVPYESYCGQVIPIDWTTEAGTVYGGYIDLITGEIIEEWQAFDMTQLNLTQFGTGTNVNTISAFPGTIKSRNEMYCNILTPVSNPNISGIEGIDWNNGRMNICLSVSRELDSQSKIEQWLNNLKNNGTTPLVVANMDTPIIHPLTPQTIKTLHGTNNIWSNANGPIELKYWTH